MPQNLLLAAVHENASWCHLVASTHGLTGRWTRSAWTCATRTPPFHPDAVTLSPTAEAREICDGIDLTSAGASVKDSFATLEPGTGWEVLFEAQWVLHAAGAPITGVEPWVGVIPAGFDAWRTAWDGPSDVLRPALLHDPEVAVLARQEGDAITAGAVLHRDGGVVGLTNLFPTGTLDLAAWTGCLAAAQRL